MDRRIRSLELMKGLQPFTQTKIISARDAGKIVSEYKLGDTSPLSDLVYNPRIPMEMEALCRNLQRFLQ